MSRLTLVALIVLLDACVGTPSVSGVAGTAPAPNTTWAPPRAEARAAVRRVAKPTALPKDLEQRIRNLTLTDIVDVALRNNPLTRISWENARAAAAAYGSERGAYLPTIDGNVAGTRLKTVASLGRVGAEQSVLAPSLSISYLLFDFGGRSGAAALALLERDNFQLMVCDVRMPGITGLELVPQALAIDADLAVVMLSAVNDGPTATRALSSGAYDYLMKPIELSHLRDAVTRALERRARRRAMVH